MPITPAGLQRIHRFPELIDYLRDELDWPTEDFAFDDLTFEYEPAELGLKDEEAAKVKTIYQLRPLHQAQPWGIFFVEFGKKRLPIVVLRRILRHLVFKKRASAKGAERPGWEARDLLFISATGEDAHRELTFAHFVEQQETGLAELRVLGWDTDDTPLHMEYVAETLSKKLCWREEYERNPEAWRTEWSAAFLLRHGHVIRTSQELAAALAEVARNIRTRIRTILRLEDGFGEIRKLQKAFRDGLIHDLTDESFADMYAQTVVYGLFSLAARRTIPGEGTAFVKEDLSHYFTSPFLKEMLGIFLGLKSRKGKIDFDEMGVSDVTDLLTSPDTHMEAVLRDFNNKTRGEDPVIHFYETFLRAYNNQLRIQRGVFYTPQPVVSYIVRSVHELLQTEFGLADGLADITTWGEMVGKHPGLKLPPLTDEPGEKRTISPDEPFVQILDPATGTATFLVEVIEVIHKHMIAKWKNQDHSQKEIVSILWQTYVAQDLLPRLHAFELMMAPYAIAHMKIGLKLAETGYRFGTEERARIYLTNALEPWLRQMPLIGFEALAHEAEAVNKIKQDKRFTVVIGNPPYSNFGQLNKNPFILGLLEDYKRGLKERKINLDDDFIKFVRFAQWCVSSSQLGVFGFITNNIYLEGATHRQMRSSIAETFEKLRVVDLHGDGRKQHKGLGGVQDENVFDIIQGVAVSLFTKAPGMKTPATQVQTKDLIGARSSSPSGKYEWLLGHSVVTTDWATVGLRPPNHFFVTKDVAFEDEYLSAPTINEVLSIMWSGIQTKRDALSVSWSATEAWNVVKSAAECAPADLVKKFNLPPDGDGWDSRLAIEDLRESGPTQTAIIKYAYRPFDTRFLYYTGKTRGWLGRPRREASDHLLKIHNLALIVKRSRMINVQHFCHICAVDTPPDINYLADQTYFMPLYSAAEADGSLFRQSHSKSKGESRTHNVSQTVVRQLRSAFGIHFLEDGVGDLKATFGPEDIFHYAYAVLHSPGYRSRYAEFLKIDFPRLPLTGNLELFRALARLGGELTALHLLESTKLAQPTTEFIGESKLVTKVGYSSNTVWINASGIRGNVAAGTSGFRGVPEAVWNFHIGGYQVCEKWLKDRKGRTLTNDDLAHYQKIVVALSETIRLMAEIDAVIEVHGGWPDAFINSPKTQA